MSSGASSPLGYSLGELLGEGGMGRVFAATRSWDGARVAIKVLHEDARGSSARRTLVNEALTGSRLAHPNLVSVVDLGEHAELGVYLVQELVQGTSLEDQLARDAPVDDGVAALVAVLEGLTAAHAGGVVHGDLKPANVLITQAGLVKVCDFGVAQALGPRKDAPGRRIRAGTPQYMAPEQFETSIVLDPRVDLYAVGSMLYQVLTGLLPHRNTESIDGILEEKRGGVPPPRFDREGRLVPAALAELVVRLTDPDLRRRPRFAAEVLEVLRPAARELASRAGKRSPRPAAPAARGATAASSTELLPTRTIGAPAPAPPSAALGRSPRSVPRFLPATSLPGTTFIHIRPPPLVGRTREIAILRESMRDAIERRAVRTILLEGEEGVGKSRLAEWALAECERTGRLEGVAARFSSDGVGSSTGLRGLVGRLYAPATADPGGAARATARWIASRCDDRELDVEPIASWLAMGLAEEPLDAHTAAALAATALRAYAGARPLYVWLDDALSSTDGAFELAQRLSGQGEGPIVLVLTCNAAALDARGRARLEALIATPEIVRLELRRLDVAGRASLLRLVAPMSRALAEEVAREVDATPLVLVQLVSDWLDRGLLEPSPAGLVAPGGMSALFDARTPTDVFRHRALGLLGTLAEAAPILFAAALLGPWCSARALHHAGGLLGLDRESVDLVLEEAVVRGVLRREEGDAHRLEHQVFRVELARAAVASPRFRELAGAVAESLLEVHGRSRPDVRAYAAMWLEQAGRIREAVDMALEAADQMARGGDVELGRRHLSLAERWLEAHEVRADDPLFDTLIYVQARLAYFSLDYAAARPLARRAVERWAARGDVERLLRAQNLELRVLFYDDRIAECEALLASVRLQHRAVITSGSFSHLHHVHLSADLAALRGDRAQARDILDAGLAEHRGSEIFYIFILIVDLACAEAAVGNFDGADAALQIVRAKAPQLDVYYLQILREAEAAIALARGAKRPRDLFVDLVEDRRARKDTWRLTAARVVLAAYDLRFDEPTARESVRDAIEAFARTPHDESLTHALFEWLGVELGRRGEEALSRRVGALLEARHRVGRKEALPPVSGSAPVSPTKPSA